MLSGSECACSRGRSGSRALCERKRYGHGLQPQRLELTDDGEQRKEGDRGLFLHQKQVCHRALLGVRRESKLPRMCSQVLC